VTVAFDGLPPLRDVIADFGIDARKSLGQNFLLDLNLTGRIARTAGSLRDCTVIEIGPGPGGLTRALLAEGATSVIAIERDKRCIAALEQIAQHYPGRLHIVEGDALTIGLAGFGVTGKLRVVANLPYNVGTQLLVNWLSMDPWPPPYSSLTLMFQKEVAMRIVAKPGEPAYGRLSVLAGWRTEAGIRFDVSPRAFTPPPKVTSSVVHLEPRPYPIDCSLAVLENLTRAAFGQRRKMLRQSLKSFGGATLLELAGIDPGRRAETLSIGEFCHLARLVKSATG